MVIVDGKTENGETTHTTIKVNLPENGMIKLDENGLYLDGNYNVGDFADCNIENNVEN